MTADTMNPKTDTVRGAAIAFCLAVLSVAGCERQATQAPEPAAPADGVEPPAPDADPGDEEGYDDPDDQDAGPIDLALADGRPTEVITFDEQDPNPGPTDIIVVPTDRSSSGSLLSPDVLGGPK